MRAKAVMTALKQAGDKEKALFPPRFFKAGPGGYGEGDRFLGVTVPKIRKIVKTNSDIPLGEIKELLVSKFHEARLTAVLMLVDRFQKGWAEEQKIVYDFYMQNLKYVNNWDIVDGSAPKIVGPYLEGKSKTILYKLVKSPNLWERRISIMSTFSYIKKGKFEHTLKLAKILLNDSEDLIHKAVGWMLREIGNVSKETEEEYLTKYYELMPRTMLRYAIEKFPESKRQKYLKAKISKRP